MATQQTQPHQKSRAPYMKIYNLQDIIVRIHNHTVFSQQPLLNQASNMNSIPTDAPPPYSEVPGSSTSSYRPRNTDTSSSVSHKIRNGIPPHTRRSMKTKAGLCRTAGSDRMINKTITKSSSTRTFNHHDQFGLILTTMNNT